MRPTPRFGFTLVEMSIVLVVIGLLIGAVLAGQEMIRAGKLGRVSTDVQKFQTARLAFETKYGSLPGDFEKATDYWGAVTPCPTGGGTGTCNGNGDAHIGKLDGTSTVCLESFRAWQHLTLAGFMQGNFTGIQASEGGSDYCAAKPGQNIPAASVPGAGYALLSDTSQFTLTAWPYFYDSRENVIFLGSSAANTANAIGPALSAADARSLDSKMDDGKPGQGLIVSATSSNTSNAGCTTTDIATTAQYAVDGGGVRCALIFR